jgi:hypothetical protein
MLLRPLWQRESMFDGTEALLPNPYDEEEEEEEEPREPFDLPRQNSERSVSEEAVNSSDESRLQR